MNQPSDSLQTKLSAARTKLILDKPFLGALVLRLPLVEGDPAWCRTTATDARAIYYNRDYMNDLSLAQTQFMLAHNALHCALSHFARRQHRVKHRWDLACDFAINPILVEEGLAPPPDAVILDEYTGMSAEEIYPLIEDLEDMETVDQHVFEGDSQGQADQSNAGEGQSESEPQQNDSGQGEDSQSQDGDRPNAQSASGSGGDGATGTKPTEHPATQGAPPPRPLTPDEQATLEVQWQQRLAGAAQQALQSDRLGGTLARMIDAMLEPRLPWRTLLAHYLNQRARDDYSYMRPSRREGSAILPSLRSHQIEVVVAVDTSGSVHEAEIGEFLAEVSGLKGQLRAHLTLVPCDSDINHAEIRCFDPWEEIARPEQLGGGGGTDFRPVFDWVTQQDMRPDVLVYFTDAEGTFPELPPEYPVIWLVKGRAKTPWGTRIQLN
jgi:predicted metal-dependent peptidase